MTNRCAQIFAAFEGETIIHRGHLVAWAMYRPYPDKRDDYVTAFRNVFGANPSTLKWEVQAVRDGLTALPDRGRALQNVVPYAAIERAKILLNGDALPHIPRTEFLQPPPNARGRVEEFVQAVSEARIEAGPHVFYGQSLNPGNLLKIGRIEANRLAAELGWWKSAHSWVIRTRETTNELLWAVPVNTKDGADVLERKFMEAFSDFRYCFKPGVPYGTESFHLVGDCLRVASALRESSQKRLLETKAIGRADEFYPSLSIWTR